MYTFQTKKTAIDYLHPFLSFSVQKFCGRTDRHFSKKFYFFFQIQNIYTYLYLSRLLLKFHPPVTKVSTPVFHITNKYKKQKRNSSEFSYPYTLPSFACFACQTAEYCAILWNPVYSTHYLRIEGVKIILLAMFFIN